ncbi:MAG: hypothetical protein SNG14_03250 [Rikenellaceae bacterium]
MSTFAAQNFAMGRHIYILIMLLHLSLGSLMAQQEGRSVGVALYDVGRFYDTIPSKFYDDKRYTPRGKGRWSSERYRTKVAQIVKVIDSLRMPIVILNGVESLDVVRDIQSASTLDYSARHATLDYYDGLDFAILYFGDMLQINKIANHHHYTYFGGELLGHSIAIHLTRRGDKLRTVLPPDRAEAAEITLAWGRLSSKDLQRLEMSDPLLSEEKLGRGDTKGGSGWYLKNRIGVKLQSRSTLQEAATQRKCVTLGRSGIYIARQLLSKGETKPLATYTNGGYTGGYSSHLPQYIFINFE